MNNSKKVSILILLIIGVYSLWNGRNILIGPRVTIISPTQGEQVVTNPISIEGLAKNTSFISLNGKQIFINKEGKFKENILLSSGYNTLEIFVRDRFNKEKTERLYLYNNLQ